MNDSKMQPVTITTEAWDFMEYALLILLWIFLWMFISFDRG